MRPPWQYTEVPATSRVRFALILLGLLVGAVFLFPGEKPPAPSSEVVSHKTQLPVPDEVATKKLLFVLGEMRKTIPQCLVSPEDEAELIRLFRLPHLSDADRQSDAVFLVWHARLRNLGPELKRFGASLEADRLVLRLPDGEDFSLQGAYWDHHSEAPQVAISLPPYLEGTLAEAALSLHELEMGLQMAYVWLSDPPLLPKLVLSKDPEVLRVREQMATRVVWELLHALPMAPKERLLRELVSNDDFRALPGAEVLAEDLKDSGLSFPEFWNVMRDVTGLSPRPMPREAQPVVASAASEIGGLVSPKTPPPPPPRLHDTDLAPAE